MGHWYDVNGNPKYTVPYADPRKGERDTTLGDAKKLGLVPSVTTITSVAGSDALVNYKLQQLLDAVLKYPYDDCVDVNKWRSAVLNASKEHSKSAAERGNEIHNALEDYYKTGNINAREREFITPVIDLIAEIFPGREWIAEASFTHIEYGYGGKVDLHSPATKDSPGIIVDFKTKSTADRSKMKAYDGHHMQLAAYAPGLFPDADNTKTERYNIFISTELPGIIELTQSVNFEREIDMFLSLLNYWQLANNYNPSEVLNSGQKKKKGI